MSYDDVETEPRSYIDIVASSIPVDRELLLTLSGMCWGYGGALVGRELGYAYPPWFPYVVAGLGMLGILVANGVMDR